MHLSTRRINCLITLAVAFIFFTGGAVFAEDSITVTSFGGSYTHSQMEAHYKPFAKKTGIKVNSVDYNGGIAEIRAQVESGNVSWDVVDLELQDATSACDEGLLEIIDPSLIPPGIDGTPAQKDFIPNAILECAVGNIVWSNIVAYDMKQFPGKKPSTMQDFFDVKQFPGMRVIVKRPNGILEYAAMAAGVAPEDVYATLSTKEGVDKAFAKLNSIKDSIIFVDTYAQGPQMMADGEAAMIFSANGRVFNAIVKEKKPFEIIWDHQIYNMDYYVIVKGSKNKENALKFVMFGTGSQALADATKYISYGPVRKSSGPLITTYEGTDVKMAPHMPTAPENFKGALANNPEWWADNQDEMIKRYSTWMSK